MPRKTHGTIFSQDLESFNLAKKMMIRLEVEVYFPYFFRGTFDLNQLEDSLNTYCAWWRFPEDLLPSEHVTCR
jgi:hypothetical protein